MSNINTWLLVGAVVIVILFCINAVVYRARFGTFLPARNVEQTPLKKKLTKLEVASAMVLCLALLIAKAWTVLAPTSAFSAWLREPYSLFICVIWCWFIAIVIGITSRVVSFLRRNVTAELRDKNHTHKDIRLSD